MAKKAPTKAEKAHMGRVAALRCILPMCGGAATVHHKTGAGGALRSSHWETMPLCPHHHQNGPFGEAVHNGTKTFESKYGTQDELIDRTYHKLRMRHPELYGPGGELECHVPSRD